MVRSDLQISRRAVLFGTAALAVGAVSRPANAQKITVAATKRKIGLANDLYLLNERLLTAAGGLTLGYRTEASRKMLTSAMTEVNDHLSLLIDGDPASGLEKEYGVAVQFVLSDLQDRWAVYGADLQALAGHAEIPLSELEAIIEDSHEFRAQVKELVSIIYEVYGEVIFTKEELRAVTLLAHERAHVEAMKEKMMFAAVFPDQKPVYMAKLLELGDVFVQTIDVLIRNGAMFGVAPPPSPEAQAALELVETNWAPKGELIRKIAENGNVTTEELDEFFAKSQSVSDELNAAMDAFNAALPRS